MLAFSLCLQLRIDISGFYWNVWSPFSVSVAYVFAHCEFFLVNYQIYNEECHDLVQVIVLLNCIYPSSCQSRWQSTVMNQFANFSYNSLTIIFRCFCDVLVCYGDLRQSKFVYCGCELYSWRLLICSTWRTMRSSWRKYLHGWNLRASSSFTSLYINRCLITLRYALRMLQVQLYFNSLIIHTLLRAHTGESEVTCQSL